MDFLNEFVALVVLGVCLCVGYIIKNVIPHKSINRYIPLIMGVLGVLLNVWVHKTLTPEILLSGLVSGLASTGLYEAFRQFIENRKA